MAFYIGTKDECESYILRVTELESYPGKTTNWSEPRKHPTQEIFSTRKHRDHDCKIMVEVERLSSDWNNKSV